MHLRGHGCLDQSSGQVWSCFLGSSLRTKVDLQNQNGAVRINRTSVGSCCWPLGSGFAFCEFTGHKIPAGLWFALKRLALSPPKKLPGKLLGAVSFLGSYTPHWTCLQFWC